MIKVLLADDHAIVRKGIRMILEAECDIDVVGEAIDGLDALERVHQLEPDVVVMDLSMPALNGVDATRRIKQERPSTKVLALTVHEDAKYLDVALRAGVAGYIPKRAAPLELVSAVRAVHDGQMFLHSSVVKHLVDRYLQPELAQRKQRRSVLTGRECEVLRLLAAGSTAREVAGSLGISAKTVERHKENMMEKLRLHNRVELVRYAISEGLVEENGAEVGDDLFPKEQESNVRG